MLQSPSKKIIKDKDFQLPPKTALFQEYATQQAFHPHLKKQKQARKIKVKSHKEVSFHTDDDEDDYNEEDDISSTSHYDQSSDDQTPTLARQKSSTQAHSGRPFKPQVDIDEIPRDIGYFHDSQSKLLFYLGEKLHSIPPLEDKPTIRRIYEIIRPIYDIFPTIALLDFDTALINLIALYDNKSFDLMQLAAFKGREIEYILGFFIFWLGKYVIHQKNTKDFVKLIIIIYHQLKQGKLGICDIIDENFRAMVCLNAQSCDYEFAKSLKLGKQELAVYLKDIINLTCNLIFHSLNQSIQI